MMHPALDRFARMTMKGEDMDFDFNRLLDSRPLPMEMGFDRDDSGILHIACRTDMHRCTGAMIDWWFGSRPMTREYRWWHPIDHISSDWAGGSKGTAVGATHIVEEKLTDLPAIKLQVQFRDPAEAFSADVLAAARASGAVSAVIFGHVGPGEGAQHRSDGALVGSRLIHIARDTQWGTALRSHFLLAYDLPALGLPKEAVVEAFPDAFGPAVLQHCYDEFTMLSKILPSIYLAEAIDPSEVRRPW